MKLENIGFYTLSDERARTASKYSPMWRCELILTDRCNFKCPYCRGLREDCRGTMTFSEAANVINLWARDGLENIRFSGGEPTMYPYLKELVYHTKLKRVMRIAISTNGSADLEYYKELIRLGVDDFSISLDACCSAFGKKMNGGIEDVWEKTVSNIREISKLVYTTVGVVFTEETMSQAKETVEFAHSLGVSDIRIISSAQYNQAIRGLDSLDQDILNAHPILRYRVLNGRSGKRIRGLTPTDSPNCGLVVDDSAIAGKWHFPCVIYLREGGKPIGRIGPNMRKERYEWYKSHNCFEDNICKENCLDVCIDYNNKFRCYHGEPG